MKPRSLKKYKMYKLGLTHLLAMRSINATRQQLLKQHDLMSAMEWFVLGIVYNRTQYGGIRVTDVASILHVNATYITAILNDLKRKGYVQPQADAADARVRLIVTTAKGGEEVLAIEDGIRRAAGRQLEGRVTTEQFEGYLHVLGVLAESYKLDESLR